jgi:hypothetical protein
VPNLREKRGDTQWRVDLESIARRLHWAKHLFGAQSRCAARGRDQ